jgi:gliding motility-associated-like protein
MLKNRLFVLFIALVLSLFAQAQCTLMADFHLDGHAADSCSFANHGTFFGGNLTSGTDRFNNPNGAVYFDGINDYINTFTTYDYQERTISFWFNAFRTNGTNSILAHDANTLNYGAFSSLVQNNGDLEGRAGGVGSTLITDTIQTGTWYHVAMVRSSTKNYYYLNGQLMDSSNVNSNGSAFQAYDKLVIGTHRSRSQDFYRGLIDDLKIFNCAFDSQGVDSLYQSQSQSPLVALPNDTIICPGDSIVLNGPQGNGINFYWDDNTSLNPRIIKQPGTYWIFATNGVDTLQDTIVIDHYQAPLPQAIDTSLCAGDSITVDYRNSGASSVRWLDNDTSRVRTFIAPVNFACILYWPCGSISDTFIVNSPDPLQGRVVDTAICNGTIKLGNRNDPSLNFLWSTGATAPQITVSNTGNYWVSVRNSCDTVVDTFKVVMAQPLPNPNIPDTLYICEPGDSLQIGVAVNPSVRFTWSNNASTSQQWVGQTGLYTLSLDNGCEQRSLKYEVVNISTLEPEPFEDTTLCLGSSIFHDFNQWPVSEIRINGSPLANGQFQFDQAGIYTIEYLQPCGTWRDTFNLEVVDCACNLILPNAFTPNGDGLNDDFRIKSACDNFDYRIVIFNRWGIQVFENSTNEDYWDGRYQGQEVPGGAFVYKIWYSSVINGRRLEGYQQGTIRLYR